MSFQSTFAKLDPAHVLDGLFTPTAKKGLALYEVRGDFDGGTVAFDGVQLSAAHQSVLLAVAARTGRQSKTDGILVVGDGDDLLARQRELMSTVDKAVEQDISRVECSAYSLLKDAGMGTSAPEYDKLKVLLRQLSSVSLYRCINDVGGTSNLLSFQHRNKHLLVSLNWRLTDAIFGGQNVHVSLVERLSLGNQPAAKILHTWLSSCIRPGGHLMAGKGAEISTLARHIWGKRPCSEGVQRQREIRTKDALICITELRGWVTRMDGSHAFISRPELIERASDPTPGELLALEKQTEQAWDCLRPEDWLSC